MTGRARRALGVAAGLALVAGLGGLLAWLWLAAPSVTVVPEPAQPVVAPVPRAPAPTPTRLRGRVLLEALADGTGAKDQVPEDMAPGTGPEGQEQLRPPPLGSCRARVWRNARLLAEAACAADGGFAVMLPALDGAVAGAPLDVVIEMLVPGRLRAVLTAPVVTGADVVLPAVALGPASRLVGEVLDRRGQPVAGVEVAALPVPSLGEPEPWRVDSGVDGRFLLDTVPEGPIRLRATRSGYALTITDAYAPETGVVIVLDELMALQGAVIGDPALVSRAKVRLEGSSLWPPLVQPVAADGGFEFPELIDGVYGLVAAVEALAPGDQEYASIPLENLAPGSEVGLALALAYRIPVKVISPDGSPVAGARVTVGYASVGLLQQVGETGPEGQVAIGPTVPGPYVIRADADGFLPSETLSVDLGASPLPTQTLTLVRPGRIGGTVVDEDGLPVADANIVVDSENLYSFGEGSTRAGTFTALLRGGSLGVTRGAVPPIPLLAAMEGSSAESGLMASSDEAGRFSLELLMPGTYRLRAVHGRFAASPTAVLQIGPGTQRDGVVLVLGRGVHLGGRLLDGNRRPLVGVRVELEDGTEVLTDDLGVFDAGYRRGRERLVLRGPGLIPQVVEVVLGRKDVELERILLPAEGELEGRVRDGNDQPIAGVRVTLTPRDGLSATTVAWTDERGLFALGELVPGVAGIELEHPDYAPAARELQVPERRAAPVELRLVAGWSLTLSVRARGTGAPIAGARIEVDDRLWATDESGSVTITRLAGAEARVLVRAGGWVGQGESVARPASGEASLRFELDEAAGMEGEVADERGEPVGGARVRILSRDGATLAEVMTTADGRWSAPDLPAGDVVVEAIPPPALSEILGPVTVDSDVRRGHVTRDVDLRLDRL